MRSASLLAVLLALVCVAAVGCGSNSSNSDAQHYPAEAISNFMASCQQSAQQGGRVTSEQAGDVCACLIKELEKTVPFEDFVAIDNRLSQGDKAAGNEQLQAALKTCEPT